MSRAKKPVLVAPAPFPDTVATHMLKSAAKAIQDRAQQRDMQDGERSMRRTVEAFNALTNRAISEHEGWLFMVCLKMARATAGSFQPDDYVDGAAYFALAGDCEANTPQQPRG